LAFLSDNNKRESDLVRMQGLNRAVPSVYKMSAVIMNRVSATPTLSSLRRVFKQAAFRTNACPEGFSLAELFITVTLVGVIGMFIIPNLFRMQQEARERAAYRETLEAVHRIVQQGSQRGEMTVGNAGHYVLARLDVAKRCPKDATAEKCWTQSTGLSAGWELHAPGAILKNGGAIAGLDNCCDFGHGDWHNGFLYDWNGPAGPNQHGQDQVFLDYCFGKQSCFSGALPSGDVQAMPWWSKSYKMHRHLMESESDASKAPAFPLRKRIVHVPQ
jgi:hypothetical protein